MSDEGDAACLERAAFVLAVRARTPDRLLARSFRRALQKVAADIRAGKLPVRRGV